MSGPLNEGDLVQFLDNKGRRYQAVLTLGKEFHSHSGYIAHDEIIGRAEGTTFHTTRGQALIEVGDTGHGMTPEVVRERLFKPFQTTKKAGMGIGAYESFQYVQELGGKITVDSELDRGTIVTVLLPLFEIQRHSDLQPLGAS